MAAFMAQMLDELMGKDRDRLPNEVSNEKNFDDSDVCKYYICGYCPHDLFVNTRTDLGPCLSIHDDHLVNQYKNSPKFKKMGYEEDFLRYLQSIKNDCEKRIKRARQRLALAPNQNLGNPRTSSVEILGAKINTLLEQVEQLGNEGNVEKAQEVMDKVEKLRMEKEQIQSQLSSDGSQEKQMEVCSICGSFLIVGDAPSRVDDHLKGKQHLGFAKVRSTIAELREQLYGITDDNDTTPLAKRSSRSAKRDSSPEGGEDEVKRKRTRSPPERPTGGDKPETKPEDDYDSMLEKESARRNIKAEDVPEHRRRDRKSRSREKRGRSRSKERRDASARRRSSRDRSRDRRGGGSRGGRDDRRRSSRSRDRTRQSSRERNSKASRDRRRSRSGDRKDMRGEGRRRSRSPAAGGGRTIRRSRSRSGGRRRNRSGETIEVVVPAADT